MSAAKSQISDLIEIRDTHLEDGVVQTGFDQVLFYSADVISCGGINKGLGPTRA